jgi:hypothetical protein
MCIHSSRVIKRTLSPGAGICVGGVLNCGGGAGVVQTGSIVVAVEYLVSCPIAALTVKHMCYY